MTYQNPIFESGLFGKANESVCNWWTETSRIVSENTEGIRWAQQQVVGGHVTTRFLAKITDATLIAPNRWTYSGSSFQITSAYGTSIPSGQFGIFTGAINLRELRNTSTLSDGSVIAPSTIGPVGSIFASGSWATANLAGYVEMVADYNSSGGLVYWFDCANPSACTNTGGGGG